MITPIVSPVEITNSHEADRALASLAQCQAEIYLINATLGEAVGRAKALAAQEAAPVQANVTILTNALSMYAEANRGNIMSGNRKSLRLTCGVIGFKAKAVLAAEDWPAVTEALIEAGLPHLVAVRAPEADRAALSKLPDEELAAFGVTRLVTETFYATPAPARVEGGIAA